jgi:hypothetical protein
VFDTPPRYRTFLLTLWEERTQNAGARDVWRYRLEDPHTGRRQGFATLGELTAYLEGLVLDEDQAAGEAKGKL